VTIAEQFKEEMKQFNLGENQDEWFVTNLCDRLTTGLTSSEAFSAIDDVVGLVVGEQSDRNLYGDAFELVSGLIRLADTTEIPERLGENWPTFSDRIASLGEYYKRKIEELGRYYRL
jgi:hypothetical protein